jgi:hypothetical protein
MSRWHARGQRDDRADPWIADAITRPPGTLHRVRFPDQATAADFGRSLYRGCRHHGVSCSPQIVKTAEGWAVEYRLYRKADGRNYVRGKRDRGETLKYHKLED